jgi:PAS domain S-box-containing protein
MENLKLDTGELSVDQVNLILKNLPVDITFVDENDQVRYFSASKDRIFKRAPGIIGKKVQNCHPAKSVHVVQRIVDEFKEGKKDVAEFWINLKVRLIYIRYFAVRDDEGKYRGVMEVTQDITDIQQIQGQKSLLEWE